MASKRRKKKKQQSGNTQKPVKQKKDFLAVEHKKINRSQKNQPMASDLGVPELENHHVLKVEYVDSEGEPTEPGKGMRRVRNVTQTTLDYCKTYHLINDEQYAAGGQLYKDCFYAGLIAKPVQSSWDFIPRDKCHFFREFACGRMDCKRRYDYIQKQLSKRYVLRQRDIDQLKEPEKTPITYWDVAAQICVDEIPIDELEKWTKWPRRSGKKLLGLVLDEVYDLYEEIFSNKGRVPR